MFWEYFIIKKKKGRWQMGPGDFSLFFLQCAYFEDNLYVEQKIQIMPTYEKIPSPNSILTIFIKYFDVEICQGCLEGLNKLNRLHLPSQRTQNYQCASPSPFISHITFATAKYVCTMTVTFHSTADATGMQI